MTRPVVLRLLAVSRGLAMGFTAAFGVLMLFSACGSTSNAVGPGGDCLLATDCAPGLICVEQPNKSRVCSDDLSRVAGRSPPEGGAGDSAAGEGGLPDGSVQDSSGPIAETGAPDTGVPDTGSPVDSGGD